MMSPKHAHYVQERGRRNTKETEAVAKIELKTVLVEKRPLVTIDTSQI
jgi:hypothetical protein